MLEENKAKEKVIKDRFIFYNEWKEAILPLSYEIRSEILHAIMEYAITGDEIDLSPIARAAFSFIKLRIDSDKIKYTSVVERNRANGSKGGRPKNPENPTYPKKADIDYDIDYDIDIDLKKRNTNVFLKEIETPDWFNDFEIFKETVRNAHKEALADKAWLASRKLYHPRLDIEKTLEKTCLDFWATEIGWEYKKKAYKKSVRNKTEYKINWRSTFNNCFSMKTNLVYAD